MAKTTGPLFSLEASGTIAKTITYSRWKGRPYSRVRVIPLNPFSAGQVRARDLIRCMALGQHWANATTMKLSGEPLRDELRIRAVTPDGFAWNGYLVDKGIGLGAANYAAMEILWNTFDAGMMTAWDDAAAALTPPIPECIVGTVSGSPPEPPIHAGLVFCSYMYALYKMDLYTLPTGVPPVYV